MQTLSDIAHRLEEVHKTWHNNVLKLIENTMKMKFYYNLKDINSHK